MLEIRADIGFPGHVVLAGIETIVSPGEGVLLLGRNGSGKTTLLRTVAGVLAPSRGEVLVASEPASRQSTRRLVGFVPDPPPLYEELTPWEHLELVRRLWRGEVVSVSRAEQVIRLLDLDSHLHQRCDTLSLGWRKRVAVAITLLHQPGLLLLDEPFNGLDQRARRQVRAVLRRHLAAGGSFIASIHQPELLDDIATRVLAVQAGVVLYDGSLSGWDPEQLEDDDDDFDDDEDDEDEDDDDDDDDDDDEDEDEDGEDDEFDDDDEGLGTDDEDEDDGHGSQPVMVAAAGRGHCR